MKVSFHCLLALLLLAPATLAQSPAKLKQELRAKESAAKKDPDALFEAGQWAAEKELAADAKRIFQAVLKLSPEHAGANEALGNELVDGKWVSAKEAAELRAKALADEYTAKGFVEVEGIWVEPGHVDDAKRGVFHDGDDLVTKEEKVALQKGMVRHPVTGELIAAKDLERAEKRYFPLGGGRWGDEKEANLHHSELKRPWVVRTRRCTLMSTLPIAKIEELAAEAEAGIERVAPLFGAAVPPPSLRPVVLIAATEAEFRGLGERYGDGTDSCGAALIDEQARIKVPYVGDLRIAFCHNQKDWGTRYLRHGAAIAYAHSVATGRGVQLPLWFLHGVGSYTSRFHTDGDAAFFGKQHVQKGGVRGIKTFLSGFDISGERLEPIERDANVYQAGLLISFATSGADERVTAEMQAITAMLSSADAKADNKAFGRLEAALVAAQPKIVAHLEEVVAKAP